MKNILKVFYFLFILTSITYAQTDSIEKDVEDTSTLILPLEEFITIEPYIGSKYPAKPFAISRDEFQKLQIRFLRENLPIESGYQFIKITTLVYDRTGIKEDIIVQHAITAPLVKEKENEVHVLINNLRKHSPYGIINPNIFEFMQIDIDTIPDWARIKIVAEYEDDFIRFAGRVKEKIEWHYLIKGYRWDYGFFLGVPKVLFDSRSDKSITYGNVSAMIRFFYLNEETGEPFPINLGIGTFGVSTPLEISKNGGGFAISLFFNLIHALDLKKYELINRANAGIEITPFFPIQQKSRILINARIGYSP